VGTELPGDGRTFEATVEMAEHVQTYVDTVRSDKEELKGDLLVEHSFDLSDLFMGLYGTNDAIVMVRYGKLIVYDYKHGAGHAVEVVDNKQLLYYALGALKEFGPEYDFSEVELVIVQPRASHRGGSVRRWNVPVDYVYGFGEMLREAAIATTDPNAPLHPGDHCRWCPALAMCPAVSRKVQETALADFTAVPQKMPPDPKTLKVDQLQEVLKFADLVDNWIKAVQQHAEDLLKRGGSIPGYKLVQKRANRKWIQESEVIKTLKPKFGQAIYAEPSILTPAQMEKMIGKQNGGGMLVDTLCITPEGDVVMAPESDKRPAVPPPAITDFESAGDVGRLED
jgi:hypothetical protein